MAACQRHPRGNGAFTAVDQVGPQAMVNSLQWNPSCVTIHTCAVARCGGSCGVMIDQVGWLSPSPDGDVL